jgi:hypothetical protein
VGIAGYSLLPTAQARNVEAKAKIEPRGGADVCILLFLQGGPSQLDTFDVKEGPWTPPDFGIQTVKPGLRMPTALLPQLSQRTDRYTIIRSMEAWEAEHARGTYYLQAGRLLSPARLKEIPSVGSVVAYESAARRKDSDFMPPFISMNMDTSQLVGAGVLPARHAPMAMFSGAPAPFVVPEGERPAFERRLKLLETLDHGWRREDTHRGRIFSDLDGYYQSAYPLLNNPKAAPVFTIPPEDHARYGNSGVGDACVMARNIVAADAGTKFIFISHNGWDLHAGAYDKAAGNNQYKLCADLDAALSNLLDDLQAKNDAQGRRLIDKSFIACMGEFGRTPGALTLNKGRDHYRYAAVGLFAGAGVKGGKVLGATDDIGAKVVDPGWHKRRSVYPEDVLVTMYSVMGIDWSKKVTQTPSGRPFEYIENISPKGLMEFGEITDLFT